MRKGTYRRRRTSSRKRVSFKKRRARSTLVTKQYLKKTLSKAVEGKRSCVLGDFSQANAIDGSGYYRFHVGAFITPGTTDAGRIGNTVHLTGFKVRYVYQATNALEAGVPRTLRFFLVQMKSMFATPDDIWFKSFNSGATNVYHPLTQDRIQDGRYLLNTDCFRILGRKDVTLTPNSLNNPYRIATGVFNVKLPNIMTKFLSNSNVGNGTGEVIPNLFFVMYNYSGNTENAADGTWQVRMCMSTYYKDT